jgi:hypothetical protein
MWGGWSQKGLQIVHSRGFFCMLKIRRRVGSRLDHLLYVVEMKHASSSDEASDTNLAVLVDGKGAEILQDITQLSQSLDWISDVVSIVRGVWGDARAALIEPAIYRYVMKLVTAFYRRIMLRLESWQCKLLKLAKAASTDRCQVRVEVARQLLAYERRPQDVPLVARKVLLCFLPELRSIIETNGLIAMTLYTPFKMLRECWRCDSQEHATFQIYRVVFWHIGKCRTHVHDSIQKTNIYIYIYKLHPGGKGP